MDIYIRVANYGPENVSDEIIIQRKHFNIMCKSIAALYHKQIIAEKNTICKESRDIYVLISLPFDVLESGCGKDVGSDYIEYWSRIFVDISLFEKLKEKEQKKYISDKIMEALLFLSKERALKLEKLIIHINSVVNKTFL